MASTLQCASLLTEKPLCVDLDGSLVKSDTLHDSLLALMRAHPRRALHLPLEAMKGKAAFKAFVARQIDLDVEHLPFNRELLGYLECEYARGRQIYLATGADIRLARRVADHLGIFAGVLASDERTSLTGLRKLEQIRRVLGENFDYIGNAAPDLTILAYSADPMLANPTRGLRRKLDSRGIETPRIFEDRAPAARALVKALRPHQWAKNLLLAVPLLLSHRISLAAILSLLGAMVSFSLIASATYIFNDLLDIEADRRNAHKRVRPFAAGDLSAGAGVALGVGLFVLGVSGSLLLPAGFMGWLFVYVVATIAYTSLLKRVALVDVVVLSGMYTLRLLAGAAATHSFISYWLAGFSVFFFLSLAFVKRFVELDKLGVDGAAARNGRGYRPADIPMLRTSGIASAYASIVIFAIYITGQDVMALYRHPGRLWIAVPFMILWLNRLWLEAGRGELHEDPVFFVLTDRASLLMGAAVVALMVLSI